MKISDVLGSKASSDVVTIRPDATVRDLVRLLADHNIGAVVVSADGAIVEGIVSERDVVRRIVGDEAILGSAVADIMTVDVITAEDSEEVTELARMMTGRRIRHVPVMSEGRLTGVVSIGDVVKHRIDQLTEERDHLESYVHQM